MNIVPTNKEQLIHFLANYISLGTYDKKFITNIYQLGKQLTTNQNALLDKITLRYTKQLAKKNLDAKELINLPWKRPLLVSEPMYTNAHVSIVDDFIQIRTPYKKDYITKLKSETNYPILWNRNDRTWTSVFTIEILKYVIESTEFYFNTVVYCDKIKKIIDDLCAYEDCKYWDPTLVFINNRYYIVACNEHVYGNVEKYLDNLTPLNLSKIATYGINIDNNVKNHLSIEDKIYDFSIQIHPTLEANDIHNLIKHLHAIECDLLVFYKSTYFNKLMNVECQRVFEDNSIELITLDRVTAIDEIKSLLRQKKSTVLITNLSYSNTVISILTDKVIHFVNSQQGPETLRYYDVNI